MVKTKDCGDSSLWNLEAKILEKRRAGQGRRSIARDLHISEKKVKSILNPGNQRILLLDIENTPNIGYTWAKYEQNVIDMVKDWYLLSFAVKWLGSDKVEVFTLADMPGFSRNKSCDKALCEKLFGFIDRAEIIVAHNGDKHDLKKINARFAVHGLEVPSPYKTVDTLKLAKRHFGFSSNKLGDLGRQLNLGEKLEHSGFDLWKSCMAGDKASFKLMAAYNKQDVVLLERVYLKLRSWSTGHPSVTTDSSVKCQICGSDNVQRRGYNYSRRGRAKRWQCKDCGGWSMGGYERRYTDT